MSTKMPLQAFLLFLIGATSPSFLFAQQKDANQDPYRISLSDVLNAFGINPIAHQHASQYPSRPDSKILQMTSALIEGDFQWLSQLRVSRTSNLFKAYFGGDFSRRTIKIWMRKRIRKFIVTDRRVEKNGFPEVRASNLSGPQAGPRAGLRGEEKTVVLFPSFSDEHFLSGPLPRLATLIHEAVHSDATHGYHEHAICPAHLSSDIRGTHQCDLHPEGPHAYAAVFFREIAMNCLNCTDGLLESAWEGFQTALNLTLNENTKQMLVTNRE